MKRPILVFSLLTSCLLPSLAWSENVTCSDDGYTILYINGIFDTEAQAKADKDALALKFSRSQSFSVIGQPVIFKLAYNPSHLAGAGDLAQTVAQMKNSSLSDYDLNTMLLQMHDEVSTRKLLLVGHSQGTLYGDEIYHYLLAHGEPKSAVSIYRVSAPESSINEGTYLNSDTDSTLNFLHTILGFNILPANVHIPLGGADASSTWPGHSFVDAYLTGASERIVGDIQKELSALVPTDAGIGDCFTAPPQTLGYRAQRVAFAVADPTAVVLKAGSEITVQGSLAVMDTMEKFVLGAYQFFTDSVTVTTMPRNQKQDDLKNFQIIKKLYGSSLDAQDVKELLGNQQGAAVAIAEGFIEGTSTTLSTSTSTMLGINTSTTSSANTSVTSDTAATQVATSTISLFPQFGSGVAWPGGGANGAVTVADILPASDTFAQSQDVDATSTSSTTTPTTIPAYLPRGIILALQTDDTATCDFDICFAPATSTWHTVNLGLGASLVNENSMGLQSITIASDSLQGDAWQLGVGCFTDAAYTEPCDDWVIGNNWNSLQHSRMLETLATTTDNKHWTAYFTNPLREVAQRPNSANPVQFNPSEYYQLFIENLGISENLYGSASLGQPYFVINGAPYPPQPAEDLPTLPGVVLASQPDNSFLCAGSTVGWRDCLMSRTTSQAIINLGVGAGLVKPGASGIQSVTIAKDQNDSNVTRAWNISIYCFADAAYTTPCVDWVMPNAWDSNQAFVATEQATSSLDHKFWTAYFTDPMHERNADGTFPLQFNPAYYYQLRIEDVGWPVGAYGSRAKQEPFWVLEGTPAEATTTP